MNSRQRHRKMLRRRHHNTNAPYPTREFADLPSAGFFSRVGWTLGIAIIIAVIGLIFIVPRAMGNGPILPPPPLCGPGQEATWIPEVIGGHWECRLIVPPRMEP